ncbi:MAG TPA: helix-turn-helix domain-containing protein [Nocardioidaceae bacterium]|nr:helix-turn-helix domain-containing protein [Nocardioidaceae bacterium]
MARPPSTDGFDRDVGRVALLGDPVRRALYRYVVTQDAAISREQAATAVGVPLHVAKFNLDRLEAGGLLESEYSRPPGRRGPGAGRPAKRYRRARTEVSLSLPPRRYDLVGRVLARAVAVATESDDPVGGALRDAARAEGGELGSQVLARLAADASAAERTRAISDVLAEQGYEPRDAGGTVTLANCPFHALAREHPALVCGMNLDLIRGLLGAVKHTGLLARLDRAPDRCCISLDRARPSAAP